MRLLLRPFDAVRPPRLLHMSLLLQPFSLLIHPGQRPGDVLTPPPPGPSPKAPSPSRQRTCLLGPWSWANLMLDSPSSSCALRGASFSRTSSPSPAFLPSRQGLTHNNHTKVLMTAPLWVGTAPCSAQTLVGETVRGLGRLGVGSGWGCSWFSSAAGTAAGRC